MNAENAPPEDAGCDGEISPAIQALLAHRLTLHEQHPEAVLTTAEVTEGIKKLKAKIKARSKTTLATDG